MRLAAIAIIMQTLIIMTICKEEDLDLVAVDMTSWVTVEAMEGMI